jgi:hypothetical protein
MAYRLTWSPSARFDLREIFAYIDEDDSLAAGRFIRSLFRSPGTDGLWCARWRRRQRHAARALL